MAMDLVNQSIASMALMPPHCPMTPHSYTSFFNDSSKLQGGVAPYKLQKVQHPRDANTFQRLEYNNFYSDWKQDAVKWYPNNSRGEFAYEVQNGAREHKPLQQDKAMELYEQTRRHDAFAVPLPTNGTNQVRILFNDKCNIPTFKYERYAAQPINNSSWFNNKLYREDISEETQEQKAQYMNTIVQNGMDIYSSVFEDMYLLQSSQSSNDNVDYIRKTY
jgi:hydroxymethylpyrimidine pyrophosphatase-like HAD family hydrolase